ncbi:hypothetical protein F4560_001113 [Saccharothrix ecbatanensis]|uniref:Uncharacterized protein n=1 Tax=Saccharothrix ecbatanensis TaxID=1105145 RepID=A0A7W9HFQ0_9PSEU|nr:hypothetical protein [Saccharothrix ecbatanensis]MBB5801345.1 hypothetical protein [Saccharothrix ecbatanensis]
MVEQQLGQFDVLLPAPGQSEQVAPPLVDGAEAVVAQFVSEGGPGGACLDERRGLGQPVLGATDEGGHSGFAQGVGDVPALTVVRADDHNFVQGHTAPPRV